MRHKYQAVPEVEDGIRFASRKEAAYYRRLKLQKSAGEVLVFLRQVPFHLPGGVRYVVDFVEFHADGNIRFVDVKGMMTATFKAKRKMVEDLYRPIKIEVA